MNDEVQHEPTVCAHSPESWIQRTLNKLRKAILSFSSHETLSGVLHPVSNIGGVRIIEVIPEEGQDDQRAGTHIPWKQAESLDCSSWRREGYITSKFLVPKRRPTRKLKRNFLWQVIVLHQKRKDWINIRNEFFILRMVTHCN